MGDKWTVSDWKTGDMGTWTYTAGEWFGDEATAKGIATTDDVKHHAISAKLDSPASTTGSKPLVVQFTVKHEKKDYSFCGGGYIKLLPGKVDAKAFGGDTPYSIMFGPDLCGYDVSRIHLIFEHNGENLLKEDEIKLDYADKDEFTHLYTLVLEKDGSYEVFLDQDPMIPNKDYAPETYAKYKDLTTVGFELWTVNGGSIFDNILVTDDKKYADKMAEKTWKKIKGEEGSGEKEAKEAWKKENEPEEEEPEDDEDDDDEDDDDEEEHDEL